MPAIVFEDVALNYSASAVGSSVDTMDLPARVITFPYSAIPTIMNDTSEYWSRQRHQEQRIYQDSAQLWFPADDNNFGSPLPFDDSDIGLWNGRFVPPPPRPPFLEESILTDGITTCDLCSWAKPTKSTFMFEGTIEKASELGWPLTLIIVSIISAVIGAILMIIIVRYKRKKSTNRNDTNGVLWWSRQKRGAYSQHSVRRNNIYTGNPSDSIRGLHHINSYHHRHQPPHHPHHNNSSNSNSSNNNQHHQNNQDHMNNNSVVVGGGAGGGGGGIGGDPYSNWRNVTSFMVTS